MKERKDWVLIALVLFITIGLFYILNYIIPFFGDDFFSKYMRISRFSIVSMIKKHGSCK